jgi:phage gpG-like protein
MSVITLKHPEERRDVRTIVRNFEAGSFAEALSGDIKEALLRSFAENFALSRTAEGTPWKPRKPRWNDDGHPLLVDTRALLMAAVEEGMGSIVRYGYRELHLGVDKDVIPYAGAHNFGVPERNLPQREYLNASEKALLIVEEVIVEHADQLIG